MFKLFLAASIFAAFVAVLAVASPKCECGFKDEQGHIWQDAIVLPFNKIDDFHKSHDLWMNDYTKAPGYGTHQYEMSPDNSFRDDAGLVMRVRKPEQGSTVISGSQVSSRRKDYFYGTYRSTMRMPNPTGSTCVGFFTYHNDTEEIDIEYIGLQPNVLYLSSKRTSQDDRNVADVDAKNYWYGDGLHQYLDFRFDWLPEKVDYFVNGRLLYTSKEHVQSTAGRWKLMHWANGDKNWSGVPSEDTLLRVTDVRVFFNSSHPFIAETFEKACSSTQRPVCDVASFSKNEVYGYDQNVLRLFSGRGEPSTAIPAGTSGSSSKVSNVLSWPLILLCLLVSLM